MKKSKTSFFALAALSALMTTTSALAENWDGTYAANFSYRARTYNISNSCPKTMSISVKLTVRGNLVSGHISNNGGGNQPDLCKKLNSGSISGNISEEGKLELSVKQPITGGAYRIAGNINGLVGMFSSGGPQHYPKASFQLSKIQGSSGHGVQDRKTQPVQVSDYNTIKSAFYNMTLQSRLSLQTHLKNKEFYSGRIDGKFGSKTYAAIKGYSKATGKSTSSLSDLRAFMNESTSSATVASTMPEQTTQPDKSVQTGGLEKDDISVDISRTTNNIIVVDNKSKLKPSSKEEATEMLNEIQKLISMYEAILKSLTSDNQQSQRDAISDEIKSLEVYKSTEADRLSRSFSTPIRPANANSEITAFHASKTFPRVPYYIPGTNEIGEISVIPRVSEEGYLAYHFDFVDMNASYDKMRERIVIPSSDIDEIIDGLAKIEEWTKISKENGINRNLEKRVICVPDGACENKTVGVSSAEIIFVNYEDGSTAGKVQKNKGPFSVGFNFSLESSLLMAAYLTYMRDIGAKEFAVGVMTDEQVLDLFK